MYPQDMSKNHTRQSITHEERYQLQRYKEANKSATQEQCAEWFFKTYGKKISQSTVSDSLNCRRHRTNLISDIRNPARSRDGKPKWPKLETPLYERAKYELDNGRPVTKPMLAKWATEMFPRIYPEIQSVPSFSIGMMARFADRNGIITTPSKEKHSLTSPSATTTTTTTVTAAAAPDINIAFQQKHPQVQSTPPNQNNSSFNNGYLYPETMQMSSLSIEKNQQGIQYNHNHHHHGFNQPNSTMLQAVPTTNNSGMMGGQMIPVKGQNAYFATQPIQHQLDPTSPVPSVNYHNHNHQQYANAKATGLLSNRSINENPSQYTHQHQQHQHQQHQHQQQQQQQQHQSIVPSQPMLNTDNVQSPRQFASISTLPSSRNPEIKMNQSEGQMMIPTQYSSQDSMYVRNYQYMQYPQQQQRNHHHHNPHPHSLANQYSYDSLASFQPDQTVSIPHDHKPLPTSTFPLPGNLPPLHAPAPLFKFKQSPSP